MGEVDPRPRGTRLRLVVQQSDSCGSKVVTDRVDVGHGVRHLLNSWTTAVEESTDGGVGTEWSKNLDPRIRVAHAQHRLTHPLLRIDFFVVDGHVEGASVESDGLVEIGDRDADMVDAGNQRMHGNYGCTSREPVTPAGVTEYREG